MDGVHIGTSSHVANAYYNSLSMDAHVMGWVQLTFVSRQLPSSVEISVSSSSTVSLCSRGLYCKERGGIHRTFIISGHKRIGIMYFTLVWLGYLHKDVYLYNDC